MIVEEDKERKLTSFQSEGMELYCKIANKPDIRFISNNWITEKWQKVSILATGKVIQHKWKGKLRFDTDTDANNIDQDGVLVKVKKKMRISLNKEANAIKKMRTADKGEAGRDKLIDNFKLQMNFETVKIEAPVFVHFEFDDFKPWWIPMNTDSKEFIADFMVPPGKWKMFFTTQMTYFVLSTA